MMRFSTLRRRLPAAGLCLALSATAPAPLPAVAAEARDYRIEAGRLAHKAGRIPKKLYATASSPWTGVISHIPGE